MKLINTRKMFSIVGGFKFLPGENELSDADFELLNKQKSFSTWLKKGIFQVGKASTLDKTAEKNADLVEKKALEAEDTSKADKSKSNKKEEK